MRKALYFLTIFLTLGFLQGKAQTYFPINATSGVQVTGGVTVTVSRSFPLPNTGTYCGTGPYQIGKNYSDWYQFNFATPVTHVKFELTRIHNDDTVQFDVNGTKYNLTGANVNAFAGTCTMTSNNLNTGGGWLSTTGGATGVGQGAEVIIQLTPLTINSVRVTHIRHFANNIASDVYFNAYLADDSCSLGFTAVADSPTCSGRDIKLSVTNFPNTTYQWSTNAPLTPNWTPSNTVYNPVLKNANQGHSGQYYVTAVRGTCIYRDTINVLVTQSPTPGPLATIKQAGPMCPLEDDTLFVPNVNLPIGGWVVAYGAWGRDTFDASQGYILRLPNVTPSLNTTFYIYAVDIQGCFSDTVNYLFKVNPDVTAAFAFKVNEGCTEDTVKFTNNSTESEGQNFTSFWNYGDNTPIEIIKDTTHYYQVPKPNWAQRDYNVRLRVTNGKCSDTLTQTVSINHPVKAEFQNDIDSLCQGNIVTFTAGDSSYVKPGTIPHMLWKYGDGYTDTIFNTQHKFNVAGIYNVTFIMEDFLKCVDSFVVPIVVDSIGGIYFTTDKEFVCVGEEILFTGQFSSYGYNSAIWDFADGVIIPDSTLVHHSYNKPGTYVVTFAADYRICPDTTFQGEYVVKPFPDVYLGEDTAICPNGDPVEIQDKLNVGNPLGIKYQWHTPTKDVTPGIKVRHPGTYSVTADLDGCVASDSIVIHKNCYINIPNVFTPNGDGISDYFLPRQVISRNVSDFEMQVYNRWGEKVFETTSINGRGWDGKLGGKDQPSGVYVYVIKVQFGNGIVERYQGNVTMVR